MTIGLIYAMRGEIESLLTDETAEPLQTVAGVSFYRIRPNVVACAGGVSKVNAAMATQLLISLYKPDLVINAGVAGCFEELPIGTLVLAEGFLQHDVDTTAVGDPIGLGERRLPCVDVREDADHEPLHAFSPVRGWRSRYSSSTRAAVSTTMAQGRVL